MKLFFRYYVLSCLVIAMVFCPGLLQGMFKDTGDKSQCELFEKFISEVGIEKTSHREDRKKISLFVNRPDVFGSAQQEKMQQAFRKIDRNEEGYPACRYPANEKTAAACREYRSAVSAMLWRMRVFQKNNPGLDKTELGLMHCAAYYTKMSWNVLRGEEEF